MSFLQELNAVVHAAHPGVAMIAEESTAWRCLRPTEGLVHAWRNMGWMYDTLDYVSHEPVHRRWHHDELTFSMVYAWDENFVLPLSHDEVVHGKQALLRKTSGDEWQQFSTLRAVYAPMWGTPASSSCSWAGRSGRARSGRRPARSTGTCSTTRCTAACCGASPTSTASTARSRPSGGRLPTGGLPVVRRRRA